MATRCWHGVRLTVDSGDLKGVPENYLLQLLADYPNLQNPRPRQPSGVLRDLLAAAGRPAVPEKQTFGNIGEMRGIFWTDG